MKKTVIAIAAIFLIFAVIGVIISIVLNTRRASEAHRFVAQSICHTENTLQALDEIIDYLQNNPEDFNSLRPAFDLVVESLQQLSQFFARAQNFHAFLFNEGGVASEPFWHIADAFGSDLRSSLPGIDGILFDGRITENELRFIIWLRDDLQILRGRLNRTYEARYRRAAYTMVEFSWTWMEFSSVWKPSLWVPFTGEPFQLLRRDTSKIILCGLDAG